MRELFAVQLMVVVLASAPASADDRRNCLHDKNPEVRIRGCSEIIRRDSTDAIAYYNRAVAYEMRDDTDRAIADYTKAIELAPDNAAAYDNRGRAYTRKGDYTRAMGDVLKASELAGKIGTRTTAAKTETMPPTQEWRSNQRQHLTMWWCCRTLTKLLSARWLRRLNCPAHGYTR